MPFTWKKSFDPILYQNYKTSGIAGGRVFPRYIFFKERLSKSSPEMNLEKNSGYICHRRTKSRSGILYNSQWNMNDDDVES